MRETHEKLLLDKYYFTCISNFLIGFDAIVLKILSINASSPFKKRTFD